MNPLVTTGQDRRRDTTALSVNVNKIALLRNQRPLAIPSVVGLARIALEAGAHGITVHPRPDERHIRAGDVHELAALLRDWPDAELNIEGNPYQNLMPLLRELRPHAVHVRSRRRRAGDVRPRLGPRRRRRPPGTARRRGALARHPGQPVHGRRSRRDGTRARRSAPTASSSTPSRTRRPGARRARPRCSPRSPPRPQAAQRLGLGVNAGHDLNRDNLGAFLRRRPGRPRGLDRPRLRRRRARARHGRSGARLPTRHRIGGGIVIAGAVRSPGRR